ncbi:AEH_G0011160.mRNA.1.CDS.1 [Saccharomyces cerevisiae]|uniref:RNA helicase n=1 Tax=Saccharomyces cerevisiae (strain JAY291) TaxID=574961 RepID=C7GTH8_YEAS2|nr:Prp28p [Saccharomyces cerevisiae YJM1615]EEU05887.1 Prp28p [Saccharomyces cerevisiae JAY291]CAE6466311.1 Prp28p [Saccharomyces cerevisiae PE-2]CAI4345141.1 BHH_G0010960.mRNA.1.CDS.1 [Saccharomyces cerevisiae]CAF1558599.1 Prp28p [Saccharomyces cerevisiae PE-2]
MARPIDVSQLIAGINKKKGLDENTSGKISKPRFLNKQERSKQERLKENEESLTPTQSDSAKVEIKKVNSRDDSFFNETNDKKRNPSKQNGSKFHFSWNESEDTLSGYDPIVSTRAIDLLRKGKTPKNAAESSYMGKHWTEKSLHEMNERDWRILKEDYAIVTKGGVVENPLRNWEELNIIPRDLLRVIIQELRFPSPTPIQRIAIPNVCNMKQYRDFLGVASTGSGKTLAFVIPILIKMSRSPPRPPSLKIIDGPKALILAPTRELVQQIQKETQKVTKIWSKESNYDCKVISIVGGHSLEEISFSLSEGCDILVATPGRLIDSLENHLLVMKQVETLVLDEADKMIDLGFEDQVTNILTKVDINADSAVNRQTLMFTATMTPVIEKIAAGYMQKPVYATIGVETGSEPLIQQVVEYADNDEDKFKKLKPIVAKYDPPIIIFINYKQTADWLAEKFQKETNMKVTILHGSKSQEQREHSLQLFRTNKVQIMIATNVAARGLDIPNVSLVVNFQISKKMDDYIHRIGRTGRAANEGTAVSFVSAAEDESLIRELYKYVRKHDPLNSNIFSEAVKNKYNVGKQLSNEIIY